MGSGNVARLIFASGAVYAAEEEMVTTAMIHSNSFVGDVAAFYYPLRLLLILALILIIADTWWGVPAGRKRKERIRFSHGARRFVNKIIDYFLWVTIAGVLELIFSQKLYSAMGITIDSSIHFWHIAVLVIIHSIELSSCYVNYCDARDIKVRWKLLKWISGKTGLEYEDKNKENENKD